MKEKKIDSVREKSTRRFKMAGISLNGEEILAKAEKQYPVLK